jgi:hypothetical protein
MDENLWAAAARREARRRARMNRWVWSFVFISMIFTGAAAVTFGIRAAKAVTGW